MKRKDDVPNVLTL